MKRLFLFIYLITVLSIVSAQTQHGHVKTRGRENANGTITPGTRLAGATITFKGNNSVTSGINGAFSFSVPNKTYCVTNVRKNGYQLYDPDLLGKIHKYSADDIPVVMDTPDNVLADKLKSEKKIRRILSAQLHEKEDEIELLKEQQKITEEQYRKLQQELYAAQNNNEKLISDMAERYSTLDFDQLDDFQRSVIAYIQNGELTRADSLLNTKGSMEERSAKLDRMDEAIKTDAEDIAKRQEQHDKSVAMKAKALEDFAADCYSRYEICLLQHKNDSAAYWLELRASKDTLNVEWQSAIGTFMRYFLADYHTALHYCNKAQHVSIIQNGENSKEVAACYNNIGLTYSSQGYYQKALEYHQKALNIFLKVLGKRHPDVATCCNNMGTIYYYQGDYQRALEHLQKALNISLEFWGDRHPDVATIYGNIGGIYSSINDYQKALEYHQKALKIRLEVLGERHHDLAISYGNIGTIYSYQGDYQKALEYHQKALNIFLDFFGDQHPDVATSYGNIGNVYFYQNDYQKALECFQKALNIYLEVLGEKHPGVATCYNNIGSICSNQNDYQKALEYFQKALKIRLEVLGEKHPDVATSYNDIGNVHFPQGDYQRALEYFQKALKIKLEVCGERHSDVATSYNNIGRVYYSLRNYQKALEYHQKALNIYLEVWGEKHPDVAESYNNIGIEYWTAKDKGIELPGFKEFTSPRVFIATTIGNDTPAAKFGMSGEYIMLEFADWTIDTEYSLFQKNSEMKGKPKTIVVMKGKEIYQYHFDNTIGIQFSYKYVGEQEKQNILKIYREWKLKR